MKSLIVILLGLYGSWHVTDLASDSSLQRVLAPLGVVIFFIALAIWLVLKAGFGAQANRSGSFFSGDGGDGGGGD